MGEAEVKACPKCASPMGIRLGELVCQECGYFMAVDAPEAQVVSVARPRAKVAAPIFNAGRRGIASYDDSHRGQARLQLEKWILISFTFLSMSLGNYLLNPAFKFESMEVYAFKPLFFAGLFLAGFAALALFIDWRGFQQVVLALVCLAIMLNLLPIYHVSQLKSQLILYKLCTDELVLIWFAFLLYRETLRTR